MKWEERSVATRDCRARATAQAAQMISGAIGRPQIASVSRKRRPSTESASSRVLNISENLGPLAWLNAVGARIARQLLQKKRTAACLAGNLPYLTFAERRIGWKQRADKLARFRFGHRLEGERCPLVPLSALEQLSKKWIGGDFFAPERHHGQQSRSIRRAQQSLEQQRPVDVHPLQVIDGDDQSLATSNADEKLA